MIHGVPYTSYSRELHLLLLVCHLTRPIMLRIDLSISDPEANV